VSILAASPAPPPLLPSPYHRILMLISWTYSALVLPSANLQKLLLHPNVLSRLQIRSVSALFHVIVIIIFIMIIIKAILYYCYNFILWLLLIIIVFFMLLLLELLFLFSIILYYGYAFLFPKVFRLYVLATTKD
jgi:hypothetical protein